MGILFLFVKILLEIIFFSYVKMLQKLANFIIAIENSKISVYNKNQSELEATSMPGEKI